MVLLLLCSLLVVERLCIIMYDCIVLFVVVYWFASACWACLAMAFSAYARLRFVVYCVCIDSLLCCVSGSFMRAINCLCCMCMFHDRFNVMCICCVCVG